MISFGTGSAVITGGTLSGHFDILSALGGTGSVGNGSLYISTAGNTGEWWILSSQVWTKLTIN
jgi:hypothetical protein